MPLLGPGDPPPYELINAEGRASFLVICDHAGQAIPRAFGDLGVSREDLDRHIGWDPGAGPITRHLSARFDAPALLGTYSRLVVDLNRDPNSETLIPRESDGTLVPGNRAPAKIRRNERLDEIFEPYHKQLAAILAGLPGTPALVSIHSFTPQLRGGPQRPWDVGVLWGSDGRMAVPLLETLTARGGLVVGDNQPYSGRSGRGTIGRHALPLGLPHAFFEVRQDLIRDAAGATRWAEILGDALAPILDGLNVLPRG
jgi:predicted N-formylglutamate amidohydrolase